MADLAMPSFYIPLPKLHLSFLVGPGPVSSVVMWNLLCPCKCLCSGYNLLLKQTPQGHSWPGHQNMGSDFTVSDREGRGCRGKLQGDLVDRNFSSLPLVPAVGASFPIQLQAFFPSHTTLQRPPMQRRGKPYRELCTVNGQGHTESHLTSWDDLVTYVKGARVSKPTTLLPEASFQMYSHLR